MPSPSESSFATSEQPRFTGTVTRFRWVILFLVFFATTINYLDRMVMGILATDLQRLYSISDVQYGYMQSAFAPPARQRFRMPVSLRTCLAMRNITSSVTSWTERAKSISR